jgi:hypothetical protein
VIRNLTVAKERGQYLLVPKILAPSLEVFGCPTDCLSEPDEGVAEAVGVEIG